MIENETAPENIVERIENIVPEPGNVQPEPENIIAEPENITAEPENIIAEPENIAAQAVNKPVKKPVAGKQIETPAPAPPQKQKKPVNKADNSGKSHAVRVNGEENTYLENILAQRQKSGLSRNMTHMLRQMINYAAHWQTGWRFGVPVQENKVFFDK